MSCAGKGRIELLLAIGASRMEATRETLQRCLVLALTPVLNQMSVMGVVSIPGMMTGQILGGTVPSQVCCTRLCCLSACQPVLVYVRMPTCPRCCSLLMFVPLH